MIRKIVILCVVVFLSVPAFGQSSIERQALKNIQKGKWSKAYAQLTRAIAKDTINCVTSYVLAEYYFSKDNPAFHIDSAYRYTQKAIGDLQNSTTKQRERFYRFPLDSIELVRLRQKINRAAFTRARETDTEDAYNYFLTNFLLAEQRDTVTMLRDEAAYTDAVDKNSQEAFSDYLSKYPGSIRAADAKTKYESLLFYSMTSDQRLRSYEGYLRDYPNTAFQQQAEQNIFEISTSSGTIQSYFDFLEAYPQGYFANTAKNIVLHLLPEDQLEEQFPEALMNDSLQAVFDMRRGYLVPIFRKDKFGFINHQGTEVIKPQYDEINAEYLCGNITDDVIILDGKILTPSGELICDFVAESVDDIGNGFILIENETCRSLIHKSGFTVGDDCIDEARLLTGKFLALKKNNHWSLWTLTGRMLLSYDYDEIYALRDVIVFVRETKFNLATTAGIARLADQEKLQWVTADEVKLWRKSLIWTRTENHQMILDEELKVLVLSDDDHLLTETFFGAVATSSTGARVYNGAYEESINFKDVTIKQPWVAAKENVVWNLFDPQENKYQSPGFDSIMFAGPFAIGKKKDSVRFYFTASNFVDVQQPVRYEFIPGQDSSSFLLLDQGNKKSVYSLSGKKLFVGVYDRILYAGEGFFVVHKKEKKGLVSSSGKILIPLEYDAIGTVNKGVVSLLKATKFGLFDCKRSKLIKPVYGNNLTVYNNHVLIASKEGLYGFIGWDNKPFGKIEFSEINYWNDTVAIVSKNADRFLYEIKTQRILFDKIKRYNLIQDRNGEKLAIIQQEQYYGVIHNRRGIVIPISFSDIVNVGSRDEPMYFTEKHVEEASIFVVIYYDSTGKMLRKEVYEDDDYEKIYCSNSK